MFHKTKSKAKLFKSIVESNIHKLAKSFTLNLKQFSENFKNLLKRAEENSNAVDLENDKLDDKTLLKPHFANNPFDPPQQVAFSFTNKEYETELDILKVLCNFIGLQVSNYPIIVRFIRDYYIKNATVSTLLTEKGEVDLDSMHPDFRVKRIKNMALKELVDNEKYKDLFLEILQAESNKLITYNIDLNEEKVNYLKNLIIQSFIYKSQDKDTLNIQWNIVREEAINILIDEWTLSKQKTELNKYLKSKSEEFVSERIREKFSSIISTKPITNEKDETMAVLSVIYDSVNNSVSFYLKSFYRFIGAL